MQYTNRFLGNERPVTATELNEVEKLLGFTFPDEFRQHYLEQNGGGPERCLFVKDDTIYVVNEFLPIKYGKSRNLFEDVFHDLKVEREILPAYLIPFADDPGGDFYCFSIRKQDRGSIWIFRGDYFDDPQRSHVFLCRSLCEFVEAMMVDED